MVGITRVRVQKRMGPENAELNEKKPKALPQEQNNNRPAHYRASSQEALRALHLDLDKSAEVAEIEWC